MNRFYWDFVNQTNGMPLPPGSYRVTMTAGDYKATQPWRVLNDPRNIADAVTVADLRDQYQHNLRMRQLSSEVQAVQARLQAAQTRLAGSSGAAADTLARVRALISQVNDQPIRYGKPGLATHVRYLSGMTASADQKVGNDAIKRYQVLKKEVDRVVTETNAVLGKP
jgi:hypothetical protein